LRIAITRVDTKRGDGASDNIASPSVLPGTTNIHGVRIAKNLDRSNRAIWYDVDIEDHILPGEKHVIFEQGMGYACAHATRDSLLSRSDEAWSLTAIRANAEKLDYHAATSGDPWNDPFDQVMMFVYGGWMFHERPAPGSIDPEQIPTGDWDQAYSGGSTTPMDEV